jgi:hypothetical protein
MNLLTWRWLMTSLPSPPSSESRMVSAQENDVCSVADQDPGSGAFLQGFGSAWIRINLSCWIRIRIQEGKTTHKNRKKYRIFIFLSTGCSLLRAEGFSCSSGVLYGGLGISKLQFLIKKTEIKFPAINFFQF